MRKARPPFPPSPNEKSLASSIPRVVALCRIKRDKNGRGRVMRIGRNRLARSIWWADPRSLVLSLFFTFALFPRLMLSRRGNPLVGFGTNLLANAFHDGDHGVVIPARAASNISINNVIAGQGESCMRATTISGGQPPEGTLLDERSTCVRLRGSRVKLVRSMVGWASEDGSGCSGWFDVQLKLSTLTEYVISFKIVSLTKGWCNRRVYDRNNLVNFLWNTRKMPKNRPSLLHIISTNDGLYRNYTIFIWSKRAIVINIFMKVLNKNCINVTIIFKKIPL